MTAGPLAGVRVLDLSTVISGPMATAYLAEQGAEVIKVESLGGDTTRILGPAKGDLSALFIAANRRKRSISLDLKADATRPVLHSLMRWADVLVENFRPGAIERLGLGYETAAALNPKLVFCSISGFGQDGPYASARVYDPIIQAASGLASTQRDRATDTPQMLQGLVCDKVTALTAAQAITAALFAAARSGKGQKIEIAMLDAAIAFLWPEGMYNYTFHDDPPPAAPDFGIYYRMWKTRDGLFTFAAVQDDEFRAVCEALDLQVLITDARFSTTRARMMNSVELGQALGGAIARFTSAELMARFLATGAPGAPFNERAALADDPQVRHNGTITTFDHAGVGRISSARHPGRFSDSPGLPPEPAPRLGEHSRAILADLGFSAPTVENMIAAGAVKVG